MNSYVTVLTDQTTILHDRTNRLSTHRVSIKRTWHEQQHRPARAGHPTAEGTQAGPHPLAVPRRPRRGRRGHSRRMAGSRGRHIDRHPRHDVRQPDQDDDQPRHLLHHRAGHRVGQGGREGGQSRWYRAGLLPRHVHRGAGHRAAGRQPHRPGSRAAPWPGDLVGRGQVRPGCARRRRSERLRAGHHPDVVAVLLDCRKCAADPLRRAAGGIRHSSDG